MHLKYFFAYCNIYINQDDFFEWDINKHIFVHNRAHQYYNSTQTENVRLTLISKVGSDLLKFN